MKVQTCAFVSSSALFEDCPLAMKAFCKNSPCYWGDNNRSLITGNEVYKTLLNEVDIEDEELSEEQKQVKTVCERLDLLYDLGNIYVDLES